MSPSVADSAQQRLDGTSFTRPLRWHTHGSYRVKGFDGTVEIREVGVDGEAPFVAPASASSTPPDKSAVQGNLPTQTSSFVGRETEVAELLALTHAHRLVTLTGVGGVGKTRFALEVARQLTGEYPNGAWLVELAPVSDSDVVPDTVATALGITQQGARSIADAIAEAVTQICTRLDGIALAIELAAARMVSMSAPDLLARLTDRFRLLSGWHRGLERHQTLRQAVQWSYDLLTDDERTLLDRCSVFAGGFDLQAATTVCGGDDLDEYAMLDVLDSLVRKSLVSAELAGGHMRYGLLETIRQFAEEKLAATSGIDEVRTRHARYFAALAVTHWDTYMSPNQREAIDWVDLEYANLRAGFRWAADKGEFETAADIAAHTAWVCSELSRYEPTRWAEEILPAATEADIRRLPRILVAATLAAYDGRTKAVPAYCRAVFRLQDDPRYDPFDPGFGMFVAAQYLLSSESDAVEESLVIFRDPSSRPGVARAAGLLGMLMVLIARGRMAEARTLAEDAVTAARTHGFPLVIVTTECYLALAHMDGDHDLAQRALQSALSCARQHRLESAERLCLQEMATLEGRAGNVARSLASFDRVIDACQRSDGQKLLRSSFQLVADLFTGLKCPEVAATLLGAGHGQTPSASRRRLREVLGEEDFASCVAAGAAMEFPAAAVRYAREQIALALEELSVEVAAR